MPRPACKGGDLDAALESTEKTLLLLAGALDSTSDAVYEKARKVLDAPLQKALLLCDPALMTPKECKAWFGDATDRYAVLSRIDRKLIGKGGVDDLLNQDGTPSVRKILEALCSDEDPS